MSKEELICSFCARTKSQTQLLIAGLDAHICDKCILQAYGIIEDENKKEENKRKKLDFEACKEVARQLRDRKSVV